MRVGVFSRWNATCGIATHAKLLVNGLLEEGTGVKVFAPKIESASRWPEHRVVAEDEPYVIRCFTERAPDEVYGGEVEEQKLLSEPLDYLIVESWRSMPYESLEQVLEKLKTRSVRLLLIPHEGFRIHIRFTNPRIFDRILVFDDRYLKELWLEYRDIVDIVPFPCAEPRKRIREFAENGLRFGTYGRQTMDEFIPFLQALDQLAERYDFIYEVIRSDGLLNFSRSWFHQRSEKLSLDGIFDLLHSVDLHFIPKNPSLGVTVSSTFYHSVSALCPTVAPAWRHFESIEEFDGVKPVVLFTTVSELVKQLITLIENPDYRNRIVNAMKRFAEQHNYRRIANTVLDVMASLA